MVSRESLWRSRKLRSRVASLCVLLVESKPTTHKVWCAAKWVCFSYVWDPVGWWVFVCVCCLVILAIEHHLQHCPRRVPVINMKQLITYELWAQPFVYLDELNLQQRSCEQPRGSNR